MLFSEPEYLPQTETYYTVSFRGDTTFNPGEIVSEQAFKAQNERVMRLGLRPARGWVTSKGELRSRGNGGRPPTELEEHLPATPQETVGIPLTPRQVDIVYFRFLDVGHQWVSFKRPEAPFKGNVLVIPGDRMGEALDILESAVDITSDWASDPGGRAEHISTVKLYEKVRDARAREA